ncbi:phage Gp37/Gp68 family protein [Achromobacter sp. DH1f]|uniref:phage Gp37/Gp68 family protein n=1 Tax=Achromobacter sp. DH1f TaxID=1397275 RepID=UPI000469CD85|nr:phage Gp37/Gp68 family protein [Achromobacter sp. DH1f]
MAENSKISWTDHTFNPWIGCTKVSPGCDHCYAEVNTAARALQVVWGVGAPRHRTSTANWKKPHRWNADHADFYRRHGRRQRVFCASLSDVFDNSVDPAWRSDLFRLIEATPDLEWLLLTKRVGNVRAMLPSPDWALKAGVWLGASIVNQEEADRDLRRLLSIPARKRFVSMEPMLGPVDLERVRWTSGSAKHRMDCETGEFNALRRTDIQEPDGRPLPPLDLVIVGGESGGRARPMHPGWPQSVRDQCGRAGVVFHFKQWGEWAPGSGDFGGGKFSTAAVALDGRTVAGGYDPAAYPSGARGADGWAMVHRAGASTAGRILDGEVWADMP